MEKELLQVMAVIDKVSTMVDGGLKVSLETQELVPEDITTLMTLKGKEGYFVFKSSRLLEEDIIQLPEEPIEPFAKKKKSQAQRIHDTLFVLWKQRGEKGDFNEFYKQQTEKIIDAIKEKLEPISE